MEIQWSVHTKSNCHTYQRPPLRRDDLESLVYVIVYLAKERLPWQGIAVRPDQVHEDEVMKLKQATTVKALCEGLPQPFLEFVEHIQCLGFRDKPDYKYLHSILGKCTSPDSQADASPIRRNSCCHRHIGRLRCTCPINSLKTNWRCNSFRRHLVPQ